MEKDMTKVSIQTLLDAGAHFGHQTRRWNPKMKPYIFGNRGDIYILDLKQTLLGMDQAYTFVSELAKKGGTVLFVGTKKQAQEAVADAANKCGMPYVNARWLGGMMTNFVTIRTRVQRMEELEAMQADGRMELLPKKEQILLGKELAKLQVNLNGIRNGCRHARHQLRPRRRRVRHPGQRRRHPLGPPACRLHRRRRSGRHRCSGDR